MAKRLVTLVITVILIAGSLSIAAASEHDFVQKGDHDYLPRWVVYPIYPLGWLLDTFIATPITYIACVAPNMTGCTSHDRRSVGMDQVDVEVPRVDE